MIHSSLFHWIFAGILITCGILIIAAGVIGIFRISHAVNRLHAAAMGDSLGICLILTGLVILYGFSFSSLKLLFVLGLFWFASPICSHLLITLETDTNEQLSDICEMTEDAAGVLQDINNIPKGDAE